MSSEWNEYWEYSKVETWVRQFAADNPEWVSLEVLGTTALGRPILLLSLGEKPAETPAFWIDAGTHAAEWTGVMALLYALEQWGNFAATFQGKVWFQNNTIFALPCISPDGYQALMEGEPFLRSTLRAPKNGVFRQGLDPQDIDGDGRVLFMRWKDPAGPYVVDEEADFGMRRRRLDDDPSEACILSQEGMFVEWDGVSWTQASLKHGLDLNRNFPVNWSPFEMFGMDSGEYPLSELESRVMMEAVIARPNIAVALTNHTYTGAILTQPYNANTPLSEQDIDVMESLAQQSVRGTDYKVHRVFPDFTYDAKQLIIGVWADCLTTTLGIPAYTLELWNPFSWAGVQIKKPAEFFKRPSPHIVDALLRKALQDSQLMLWRPFEHPQLGQVEIGGFDYFRTIRNPPNALLEKECQKGFQVAENLRKALPKLQVRLKSESLEHGLYRITAFFENLGYLSTTSLERAKDIRQSKELWVELITNDGIEIIEGQGHQVVEALEGWGSLQVRSSKNMIYPSLPVRGHRDAVTWIVRGRGSVDISWDGGRAGKGVRTLLVNADPKSDQLNLW